MLEAEPLFPRITIFLNNIRNYIFLAKYSRFWITEVTEICKHIWQKHWFRIHQISLKYASIFLKGEALSRVHSLSFTMVWSLAQARSFSLLRNYNEFYNLVNRSQWACRKYSRWQPASSQPQEGRHDAGTYIKISAGQAIFGVLIRQS